MKLRMWCIALLLFPVAALACVNTQNGNICIPNKDIAQKSGDHELNLSRVYNSNSTELGWLGYGWGTSFETRLVVMPYGSAVVQYHDTGKVDRYASQDEAGLQAGVEKIAAMAVEKEGLGVEAAAALRSRLLLNEEFRRAKVLQHGMLAQLPVGVKLHSSQCAKALVTRIKDEYQRITCGKGIDYFDLAGRLVRQEEDGYKVFIHYAGNRPDRIDDSLGQKLELKWTATGRIAEAKTAKDAPVITYRYDENDNLVFASDADGNDASYAYDIKHKLTAISYHDQTRKEIQYDEIGRVTVVTETDAEKIAYTYRLDPEYPSLHHWTTATTMGEAGKQKIREAEYFASLDTAGVERLTRVIKTDGQGKEEIVLDEQERLKHVQKADGSFSDFIFHPTLGKVTVVSTKEGRTDFSYDKAGNLIRATTDKGQLIKLGYDNHNRIIHIVESNKAKHVRRELSFKYNEQNKPVKISMIGKGTIVVVYDAQGEISKVDSKQGAVMALEVTQAFSELLSLVKVAGANYCL